MKNRIKIISIFVVVILLVSNINVFGQNDIKEINTLSNEYTMKVENLIKNHMKKGKLPGVSVVIVKEGKIVYQKGFGYSDLENKKRVTPNTLFDMSSSINAFTALGLLELEKYGKINLEETVDAYLPWFMMMYKGKEHKIKIIDLLNNSSGIPFNTTENYGDSLEEKIKTIVGGELFFQPGLAFQEVNINYDILRLIIEKVTGETYENYIEKNIIKEIGLNNTYISRKKTKEQDVAKGYKRSYFKNIRCETLDNSEISLYSNAKDMGKWIKLQMETLKDTTFDTNLIDKSHIPNRYIVPRSDGSSYGNGWYVFQKPGGKISYSAHNPSYSSHIVFRPKLDLGVVVLSNTNSAYVKSLGEGLKEVVVGVEYRKNISDINQRVDVISLCIIFISILMICFILFLFIKYLNQILRKERKISKINKKIVYILSINFFLSILISYSLYLIPYVFFGNVSWKFMFKWFPTTLKPAIYIFIASIWCLYIYSVMLTLYKKEDDKYIFIIISCSIFSGLGNSLIIMIINTALKDHKEYVAKYLIYFVIGITLYIYGQLVTRYNLTKITNNLVYSKRKEIIKAVLVAPYEFIEKIGKSRIQATLNNDTRTISKFMNALVSGVTSIVILIFSFIYLGFINKYALLLSIIIIIIISYIYFIVGKYAKKIGEEKRELENDFFKFINNLIGGIKELTLNKRRKIEFQNDMYENLHNYRVKTVKSDLAFANVFIIGELLFTLAVGASIFIFPLILKNAIAKSEIYSFVFVLLYITGPVHGILNIIPTVIEVKISFDRIKKLLKQLGFSNYEKLENREIHIEKNFKMKLNGVQYEYDNKGFKLGPVDYEFNSGEMIFITGGNGSGKSTLTKLLTGLYSPSKGYITINNNRVSEKILNESYSTVFSDFYLFDKLYGIDYEGKEEKIQKYLEILQLDTKIRIEDGQFSTTKLSTGQKKRLALLVTYLEDRPIYLFDEWAADQDPEFRRFFYNMLLPELKERGKCVIAVTHDDHYFHMADKVIKMEIGKISNV